MRTLDPLEFPSIGTFDLTDLSRAKRAAGRRIQRLTVGVVSIMAIFAGIGGYLTYQGYASGANIQVLFGSLALLVGSLLIGVQFAFLYRIGEIGPSRLTITQDALVTAGAPGRKDQSTYWGSKNLRLVMYDLRPLGDRFRSGRIRDYKFVLVPSRGYQVAIPLEAFESVLQQARIHGLRIEGEPGLRSTARRARRVTIRAAQ